MENGTTQCDILEKKQRISSDMTRDSQVHSTISQDRTNAEKHAGLVRENGKTHCSLLVWGCGEFGQHGHGHKDDITLEKALTQLDQDPILRKQVSPKLTVTGSTHTLVITEQNEIYSWGNGSSGQLGNGASNTIYKPQLVHLETTIAQISGLVCGARHSFIWMSDGQCYSFGNNFNAQLGYNFSKPDFKENQLKPVLVEFFPGMAVKEVACGSRHSLFLLTTGSVMAVGCNQHGQIGDGTTKEAVIPIKVAELATTNHIACGSNHSLAVSENNQLFAWGYGKAIGTKTKHLLSPKLFPQVRPVDVRQLVGGDTHSMVLYCDGQVAVWGNNYEGQLGLGNTVKYESEPKLITEELLPQQIINISCSETTCAAVTEDGRLFMWGKNAGLIHSDKSSQHFQFVPLHIETGRKLVKQVSCGAWHMSAIIRDSEDLNIVEKGRGKTENRIILGTEETDNFRMNLEFDDDNDMSCVIMKDDVHYYLTDKQAAKNQEINMADTNCDQYQTENSVIQETMKTKTCTMEDDVHYYVTDKQATKNQEINMADTNCARYQTENSVIQETMKTNREKIKQTCHHLVNNNISSSLPDKSIINNVLFTHNHTGLLNRIGKHKLAPLDRKKAKKVQKPDPSLNNIINGRNNINSTQQRHHTKTAVSDKHVDTSYVLNTACIVNDKLKADIKVRNNSMPELVTQTQHNAYGKPRPKTVPIINLDFENRPRKISVVKEQKSGNFAGNFRTLWKSTCLFRAKQPKNHINHAQKPQHSYDPLKLERVVSPKHNQTTARPSTGRWQQKPPCPKHDGKLLPALCSCADNRCKSQ